MNGRVEIENKSNKANITKRQKEEVVKGRNRPRRNRHKTEQDEESTSFF